MSVEFNVDATRKRGRTSQPCLGHRLEEAPGQYFSILATYSSAHSRGLATRHRRAPEEQLEQHDRGALLVTRSALTYPPTSATTPGTSATHRLSNRKRKEDKELGEIRED